MITLSIIPLKKSIKKSYLIIKPIRDDIERFKSELKKLLNQININETEEHNKNFIRDFLINTFYNYTYVNTKGRTDLAIHLSKSPESKVGVIIEVKSPSNRNEMISENNINCKAFHEVILYYLRERIDYKNDEIKNIIITNGFNWYIFKAEQFEKYFYKSKLKDEYVKWRDDKKVSSLNEHFYNEIAKKFIDENNFIIESVNFNIKDFEKNLNIKDEKELIPLYKKFSPPELLKETFANDSNNLNKQFYSELLHIIGLEEYKDKSKKKIERKKENRESGSLIENTISILKAKDVLRNFDEPSAYGVNEEEQLYNIALELNIIWINRILFLKLLEGQLVIYNDSNPDYKFLEPKKINQYDDLFELFHQVLAVKVNERNPDLKNKYKNIPYLNSSLFDISTIERKTIDISSLKNKVTLSYCKQSVFPKEVQLNGTLPALNYLLLFLDAYDFASEGSTEIIEEKKTIINASVLGLIFEKINGYKEGSFYTPGFITMYMARETLRRAVIQKFSENKNAEYKDFEDLKKNIDLSSSGRIEANKIVNSIKICDPAVGSGHFLVSCLNELIAIKSELGILNYRDGRQIQNYSLEIENDELIITNEETDELFHYRLNTSGKPITSLQNLQEALFHEKETLIENSLFGVDINPNSVNICRLRLWIELLKNSYYTKESNYSEIETLPNIDINIKQGNSLISRFNLDTDLSKALKTIKYTIDDYKKFVQGYREAKSKEDKRNFSLFIEDIKKNFKQEINNNDPRRKKLSNLAYELHDKFQTERLIDVELSEQAKKKLKTEEEKLIAQIDKLKTELNDEEKGEIYKNAFEWRFEFPEVLNAEGNFIGFDMVIGNPPYVRQEEFSELKSYLKNRFEIFHSLADLLTYFVELSYNILKKNGVFQFIISGKFTRAGYGNVMRKFLSEKTEITHFIDFGGKPVFDEATVDAAIIGFIKQKPTNKGSLVFKDVQKEDNVSLDFDTYIQTNAIQFPTRALTEDVWSFDNPKWLTIIEKINKKGIPLCDWDITINFGIKTGYNEAFIIDEAKKNDIIEADPKSEEILKPLLRGRDIQKYVADAVVNWVIGTFPSKKLDINEYFGVKDYLLSFGKTIHQTGEKGSRKKTSHKWFETQDNIAFWKDFEKPKLVWKRIGSILRFCYDESGAYCLDSTCIATGSKVKFLTAVLNSKLCNKELFRLSPKTGTGDLIISVQALNPLRIPVPNEKQEIEICALFDRIIELKKQNSSADTTDLENQIDKLVYKLYDLTEEEIKIVEGE